MVDPHSSSVLRVGVGTHFRVWWLWLPLIVGGLTVLLSLVLFPVAGPAAVGSGYVALGCLIWTGLSVFAILRGRRWLEYDEPVVRIIDREGVFEFRVGQVTDVALVRTPQHAGGRLVGIRRELTLWVDSPAGARRLRLVNRLPPYGHDPLHDLIDRLSAHLLQRAAGMLASGANVDGDGWTLNANVLHVTAARQMLSLPVPSIAATEAVGQELRIWREGNPRAVVRIPLAGRNTWMLHRLLQCSPGTIQGSAERQNGVSKAAPLGRILFERTTGPVVSVMFGLIGFAVAAVGVAVIAVSVFAAEPVGVMVGALLGFVGGLCLMGGLRARRLRFCCHEHGIERITMTGRQMLPFSRIDVFSFESHRNRSHGRYTGTTYTLVFADRSRDQDRGIFFSTTVRNTDEELELLRDRVAAQIARRMAAAYARNRRVQWTPELWLREEVLEFSRPRRFLTGPKLTIVPYDAITDFEVREGTFYLWTNYQERAVISVKASSANFYPGLIVLESLVNAHARRPVSSAVSQHV